MAFETPSPGAMCGPDPRDTVYTLGYTMNGLPRTVESGVLVEGCCAGPYYNCDCQYTSYFAKPGGIDHKVEWDSTWECAEIYWNLTNISFEGFENCGTGGNCGGGETPEHPTFSAWIDFYVGDTTACCGV